MYDILQLNEMLVPELKQVAEQLDIDGFDKLTKQELIYKILDQQAISGASEEEERKKRKPRKPLPKKDVKRGPTKEDDDDEKKASSRIRKKVIQEVEEVKPPVKRIEKPAPPRIEKIEIIDDFDDFDDFNDFNDFNDFEPIVKEEIKPTIEEKLSQTKSRRFNIELDGMIEGEGILEMMPDGYGFLRSSDYNYLS
jgi:transcription termination factor Rho